MSKLEKLYYILLFFLFAIVFLVEYYFISLPFWYKSLLYILTVMLFSSLFAKYEEILDKLLPGKYKDELGFYKFYNVKWISKEFDEFAGEEIIKLRNDSWNIYNIVKEQQYFHSKLYDYSFVVLPLAKAYEGFLKKILVEIKLINEADLLENPDLSISNYFNPVGNSSIFNSLRDKSREKTIPHFIYITYQECRNQILHYDPYGIIGLASIEDASFYMRRIEDAIYRAYDTFKRIPGKG